MTPNPIRPSERFLKFYLNLQVLRDIGYMHNPIKLGMKIEKSNQRIQVSNLQNEELLILNLYVFLSEKNVWSIDVIVALINNDGNLLDAIYLCFIFEDLKSGDQLKQLYN
ncbi:unnamed protein product [Paramecium octaurelia]|uniref:Uncharacterized protein n=1 Tax=Paramecium octaurelia TaxID=43137 RepID=A0A8S1UYX9_PAROT|nr:unnamed protein product [Paramecium octaurelia]